MASISEITFARQRLKTTCLRLQPLIDVLGTSWSTFAGTDALIAQLIHLTVTNRIITLTVGTATVSAVILMDNQTGEFLMKTTLGFTEPRTPASDVLPR